MFKAVAAMMRELTTHGTTIVGTIGPASPMSMLIIGAPDSVCVSPLRWKRDRSLAGAPGSADDHPSDELTYPPATE
jgi:hypothetical protein